MKVTERNNHDHVTKAELTPEEINTVMWALYYYSNIEAMKLRDDLCGVNEMTIHFDGRGENGL